MHLSVHHSTAGLLHYGLWSTDRFSIFRPELKHTFDRIGSGEVTLEARYSGRVTRARFRINVVNTPPSIAFVTNFDAFFGEPHQITAEIVDRNEPDYATLCSSARWTVGADHQLSATTGCQVTVVFGATGRHRFNLEVTDRDGATTRDSVEFQVHPAPVNPYPRITDFGVFATVSAGVDGCRHVRQPSGGVIDLRLSGCTPNPVGPTPPRYFASVTVENPSGETLTYDWQLLVRLNPDATPFVYDSATGSSSSTMPLRDRRRTDPRTADCTVTASVNAPEPQRTKTLVVWTGQCIANWVTVR